MIAVYVAAAVVFLIWFIALRPRKGGPNAPPVVTDSKAIPIPFIGVIAEFFKGPQELIQRSYQKYGAIFTVPVSNFRKI